MSNYIHIINKKSSNNLKQHNIQTSVVMMIQRNVYFWFPSLLKPFHSHFISYVFPLNYQLFSTILPFSFKIGFKAKKS